MSSAEVVGLFVILVRIVLCSYCRISNNCESRDSYNKLVNLKRNQESSIILQTRQITKNETSN